jgi:hypothetical protein
MTKGRWAAAVAVLLVPGPVARAVPQQVAAYPFAVGETLRYEAKLGVVPAGWATTTVQGTATSRGDDVFVLSLRAEGGPRGFGGRWSMTSWVGVDEFTSRRFHRSSTVAGRSEAKRFEIVPDSLRYREEGSRNDFVTPPRPLDELALVYHLRTLSLAPGRAVALNGYFRNGYNPVTVRAIGREPITLGDGSVVSCLALQVSAAGSTSELWLTDDARRLPARVRVQLPFGRATLTLAAAP